VGNYKSNPWMFKKSMLNTEKIKQRKGVEISEQSVTSFSSGQIAVALRPLDIKTVQMEPCGK